MPVDLSGPNSIIQAFATGVQQRQESEKLKQQRELQEQQMEIRRDQLKQENEYHQALLDAAKQAKRITTMEAIQKIQEGYGKTGNLPPGIQPVYSGVENTPIGPIPSNTIQDSMGRKFQQFKYPELSEESFNAAPPETYADITGKLEEAKYAPRAESAAEIAQLRGDVQSQLREQQMNTQLTLAEMRGELSSEARKETAKNQMDLQKFLEEGRNKRAAMRNTNTKNDTQARIIASQHDSSDVYKRSVVVQQARNFVNQLPANSKSAADDIGLVYAFAKAMDPQSTVREGEYATVQKYAQSWKDEFGFTAQRILNNSEFLTPVARQRLKNTIAIKANAELAGYKNYRGNIVNRLNKLGINGSDYLGSSPEEIEPSKSNTINSSDDLDAAIAKIKGKK